MSVCLIDNNFLSSFQGKLSSTCSFHASLLQVADGVMSLALCPQVVSQAPHHLRSSETQTTCNGYFVHQSIFIIIIIIIIICLTGMSQAVHPQESSMVAFKH